MAEQIELTAEASAAETFAALKDGVATLCYKIEVMAARPRPPEAADFGPSFGEVLGKLAELETKLVGIADCRPCQTSQESCSIKFFVRQ